MISVFVGIHISVYDQSFLNQSSIDCKMVKREIIMGNLLCDISHFYFITNAKDASQETHIVLVDELPRVESKVHVQVNDGEVRNVRVLAEQKGFISIVN